MTQYDDELRRAAREAGARGYMPKDDLLAVREFQRASPPAKEV